MRYRSFTGSDPGTSIIFANPGWPDDLPLVHIFRDDELDELAAAILNRVLDYGYDLADQAAAVDVLRNHGQPD